MAPSLKDKLVVALAMALDEIQRPGFNEAAGINIVAICESLLSEAIKGGDIMSLVRKENDRRRAEQRRAEDAK